MDFAMAASKMGLHKSTNVSYNDLVSPLRRESLKVLNTFCDAPIAKSTVM
jgi:hypothetical protein